MDNKIKNLDVSYDFISNDEDGELMMVMEALEGTADDDNAKFLYDGISEALLVRSNSEIFRVPILPEIARNMLGSLKKILVTEMDGDNIADVYEAQVEIVNPL